MNTKVVKWAEVRASKKLITGTPCNQIIKTAVDETYLVYIRLGLLAAEMHRWNPVFAKSIQSRIGDARHTGMERTGKDRKPRKIADTQESMTYQIKPNVDLFTQRAHHRTHFCQYMRSSQFQIGWRRQENDFENLHSLLMS